MIQADVRRRSQIKRLLEVDFLLALSLLILNDLILKRHFGNWFTGKLSDFSGLYAFTVFGLAMFPKRSSLVKLSIVVLFVWWKSSLSQGAIDLWNGLDYFRLDRLVDATDLWALPMVLLASQVRVKRFSCRLRHTKPLTAFIVIISMVSFVATSVPMQQAVLIDQSQTYSIQMPRDSVISYIKTMDVSNSFTYYPYARRLSENVGGSPVIDSLDFVLHYDSLADVYSRFPYGKFKLNTRGDGVDLVLVQTYYIKDLFSEVRDRHKKKSERQFKRRFVRKIRKKEKSYLKEN